jgi:hypothetical protein
MSMFPNGWGTFGGTIGNVTMTPSSTVMTTTVNPKFVIPTESNDVLDELLHPYMPNASTQFTTRTIEFKFLPKTIMPANVRMYDGTGDPEDHL